MENYDVIANGFTSAMKHRKATDVYNHFSGEMRIASISEAKEMLRFIRELQTTDDYLLKISKGGNANG